MQDHFYQEEYDYDEEEVVTKKTNPRHDSSENQKSSRQGQSRRDKERQRKQRQDRKGLDDDRWN